MKHKRCISLITSMIVLLSFFSFFPNAIITEANALTNNEITNKLTALQSTYPNGSYWIGTNVQRYGGYQCYAFARQLAVDVFGSYPAKNVIYAKDGETSNGWTAIRTASKVTLEPGDIIRADNDSHSAMIWKIEGNNVYVGQCWGSQNDKINWGPFWGNNKKATVSELLGSGFNGVWKHPDYQNNSDSTFFDFWGIDNGTIINGNFKVWLKQVGLGNSSNSDVNLYIDSKESANCLGTLYQDNNGFFSYEIATGQYSVGEHTLYAVFRNTSGIEKWVSRTIVFEQSQFFDFWGIDNDTNINENFKVWLKQVGLGNSSNSDVNLYIDGKEATNCLGTIYQDENGFYSYTLNTTFYPNGFHTLFAVFRNKSGDEIWRSRNVIINNAIKTYTLSVNPNGGTYNNKTTTSVKEPSLILNSGNWWDIGIATRNGYTLTGYFTAANGGIKVYDEKGQAVDSPYFKDRKFIGSSNLTVYAQWTPNTSVPTTTTVLSSTMQTTTKTTTSVSIDKSGDVNCDGDVTVADAVAILQYIGNKDKYNLSDAGKKNADVDGAAGITGKDALVIQQVDAGLLMLSDLPLKAH